MQRYGQLSAKPPAKPPPEQNCDFIMIMILAWSQIQSGGMLLSEGILRTGEELLHMSQESKRSLWQKYADRHANLISRQVLMLKKFRFCAFLWAKLLGKQSWQPCQMRIRIDFLRRLMTKCIPRISISSIRMPESPVKEAWQLRGSVVYDPSGFMYNGIFHDWSEYHHHIKAITSHSKQSLIALMHSDGNVWIRKIGNSDNLFWLIHSPKKDEEKATAFAFHPDEPLIAVAVKAHIMVYRVSPSLKPELHFTVSFYESGYDPPKPKYSADKLDWNPDGTFLTAISEERLSMCYFIDPDTCEPKSLHGNKIAELIFFRGNIQENMSPSCSRFAVGDNRLMIGYPDGTLMTGSAGNTAEKGLSLTFLKRFNHFLRGQIDRIEPHPHNPPVFAIQVDLPFSMKTDVFVVSVDKDGSSVTITATIANAKSPYFYEDWLIVSSENRFLFYHMNPCNIPRLVTEFHLPNNGMMLVRIGAFCVKTAPNGKVMLYYSISGESKLHSAEITFG